jgi:hypothetical protein
MSTDSWAPLGGRIGSAVFASGDRLEYGGPVKGPTIPLAALLAFAVVCPPGLAEEPRPFRIVFNGANDEGEVWANVGLTVQRLDQDYLPMVVMVVNRARETAMIDRDSIRLVGPDGARYPMPALKELRKGYRKITLDARAVSGAGIPYEVWQRDRRLLESNFFPNTLTDRRAIVIDEVNLPPSYAMIDLLYFATPKGLAVGVPFILEVRAVGWEAPVRLGIVLD